MHAIILEGKKENPFDRKVCLILSTRITLYQLLSSSESRFSLWENMRKAVIDASAAEQAIT